MDESGDLRFDFSKSKTSKVFIVSFLFVPDENIHKAVSRIVLKVLYFRRQKNHMSYIMRNQYGAPPIWNYLSSKFY